MATLKTENYELWLPQNGEPDLASDVRDNMNILDAVIPAPDDIDKLIDNGNILAEGEMHTHALVQRATTAATADKVAQKLTLNGTQYDGSTQRTMEFSEPGHSHAITDIADLPSPDLQLRRIFYGTEASPSESTALNGYTPKNGDVYLRIR